MVAHSNSVVDSYSRHGRTNHEIQVPSPHTAFLEPEAATDAHMSVLGSVEIHRGVDDGGGEMDDGGEALVGFVGAHGDAFELLELAEEVLDQVAPFVDFGVDRQGRWRAADAAR